MKKMKKLKVIPFILLAMLINISCSIDDEPQNLEKEFANLLYVVGFDRSSDSYVFLPSDTAPVSSSVYINLSSGPGGLYSTQATNVRYEVDAATDAIIGTEFEITNTSNTFVIPAGGEVASATLDYTVFPSNLPFDTQKRVVLNLISETVGVSAGEQIATIEIVFERCDPPLAGSYIAANTVNGSSNGDGESVNIVPLECNRYRADNLPNFNGVFTWDFILNDDDTITLVGTLGDFSNVVNGSGVLLANGTIQVDNMNVLDTSTGANMSFDLIPN